MRPARSQILAEGDHLFIREGAWHAPLLPVVEGRFAVDDPDADRYHLDVVRRDGALAEASWGPRWLSVEGRASQPPGPWTALAGRYRSWNAWAPGFDVFDRGGALWLELFGTTDVGSSLRLTPLEDGSFVVGEAPSPSRVRFDTPIGGRMTRAVFDAAPFFRVASPA